MTAGKSNLPASVAARLLNRLGKSEAKERFMLKGAMLLRVWSEQPYRATRDLDLLRKGDGSFQAIRDRREDDLHGSGGPGRGELRRRCDRDRGDPG